jgi:hypothetical protein
MGMKTLIAALTAVLTLSASAQGPTPTSPEALDQLFGPVALYPDALLGPMLLSAANPSKIGALSEWLRSHETLKGTALQDAAKAAGFTESDVALVLFPQVVNTMAQQLEWTTKIGQAFTADRAAVCGSIQRLRAKAKDAGKLKTNPQQSVTTETTASGQQMIVIEPTNPQIVYVPQYNPQTVYVPSTVVVQEEDDSDAAVAAGLIGFTAGIALGAAMDNDYYYGPYGWGGGFRMYNDAWDDWYDHRDDAREDYAEHREDLAEERGDRARTAQEQRTDRTEARTSSAAERTDSRTTAAADQTQARAGAAADRVPAEARGQAQRATASTAERSGTRSDAFSGYSNGASERAASSRGASSRSSSRSGGGRRR